MEDALTMQFCILLKDRADLLSVDALFPWSPLSPNSINGAFVHAALL